MIGDLTWTTPGQSSADSLPIGNGDLAANVWTEPNGDILLYVAKNDAWDHLGRLVKLGRLRLRLDPPLNTAGPGFAQHLSLAEAAILIKDATTTIRLWADAHSPRLQIEVERAQSGTMQAGLDPWRTQPQPIPPEQRHSALGMEGGPAELIAQPDTILPHPHEAVIWYHRNESSIWGLTLDQQGLGDFKPQSADPLLHRIFGGCLSGEGFHKQNDTTLVATNTRTAALTLAVHTAQPATVDEWIATLGTLAFATNRPPLAEARAAHQQWWRDFWARAHLRIESRHRDWHQAETISQQLNWHRYLVACCSRGRFPLKFNGGLFTADWGLAGEAFDADYRRWGGGYWWQNTRLPYWSVLAHGDYELLRPLFRMYREMLPLAEHRSQKWFGHPGAFYPETLYFWGTHLPSNYGWNREGKKDGDIENQYIRRYWVGALELVALMLETHRHTGDTALLTEDLLPVARSVLTFFARHYGDDAQGRLHLAPAQSLETWWQAENPTPEIAGLHYLLPRLLALPGLADTDHAAWRGLLARLPALPVATVDGQRKILPAEKHENVLENTENPELYAVFPFRLYGLGRPDLDAARWTFARRLFPDTGGWRQDALQAALLGLTETAAFYAAKNFTEGNQSPARFKGFWGPNYDWIPDFDHGSVGQLALQHMLVQTVEDQILLFPAWPVHRWNVSFKLHLPRQTTIEGELKDGQLVSLLVTPPERRADVVILLDKDVPQTT